MGLNDETPQIGQVVKILRGRDKDQYAVIVRILDQRFVLIADGDKRKFDQPKKKNRLHIKPTGFLSEEVADSIKESGRVTNGKLRFAVNKFLTEIQSSVQQKGE